MGIYNVQDAQIHLSRLLDQAAQGEEVIIAKDGRPVAKLVRMPVEPRKPGRGQESESPPEQPCLPLLTLLVQPLTALTSGFQSPGRWRTPRVGMAS